LKRVAIIGSHGLYANYGGWDQLVKNLAEKKSEEIEYLVFNSSDSAQINKSVPSGVIVKRLKLRASGFEGLFYDFLSIILCYWKVDTLLFLGVQGMPIIPFLKLFRKVKIVANVGGIEWERPKFGFFAKTYLRACFKLSFIYSDYVILDNQYYKIFEPEKNKAAVIVIPYGGEIDRTLEIDDYLIDKYPFLRYEYFLSISRSLQDNQLDELCESFSKSEFLLVLISNLTNSSYGMEVMKKWGSFSNIILINGLYSKPELDLIRRKCKAYIHTHTLCGTAPSLVEMIISGVPIFSVDRPQNRYTLNDEGYLYSSFSDLHKFLSLESDFKKFIPSENLKKLYDWNRIIRAYEMCF